MTPLSVVVATTQSWPEVRSTLDSLIEQARACGAEIIVPSTSGQEISPEESERYHDVIWLNEPGATVFALRALGLANAKSDLVATTEDHCRARPDWCANLLLASARNPGAGIICGAVENGCPDGLKDWAHHFLVFGPAASPILGAQKGIWAGANVAYRRRVLPQPVPKSGLLEMFFVPAAVASGEGFAAADSAVVEHVQPFPFEVLCGYHFHNGRTIATARNRTLGPFMRLVRAAGCAVLPLYLVALRFIHIWPKKKHRRRLLLCLPWLAAFGVAQASGEFLGYLAGPGTSAGKLR